MFVRCFVHGQPFPKSACHIHHEQPRSTGGSDDQSNLLWLCATCHSTAHRVAQLAEAGRHGEAEDICMGLYPLPAQRQRFKQVIREILDATAKAKVTGKRKAKAMIELELSHEVHARLKLMLAEHKMGGKKIGVAKYIEAIVASDLKRKGY